MEFKALLWSKKEAIPIQMFSKVTGKLKNKLLYTCVAYSRLSRKEMTEFNISSIKYYPVTFKPDY